MCQQAVHKRINKFAVAFLLQVISDLITNRSTSTLDEFYRSGFKRILVEDSTTLRLPKANAEIFPAHGMPTDPPPEYNAICSTIFSVSNPSVPTSTALPSKTEP